MKSVSLALLLSLAAAPATALELLSSEEMSGVTGQDGIAFNWDLRINADATGQPLASVPLEQRRFAIKFANREECNSNAALGCGEWVVFKGFSGRIYMPTFNLGAFSQPVGPTPFADISRFGSANPYGSPALKIEFIEPIEFWEFRMAAIAVEYGNGLSQSGGVYGGFRADPTDARSFMGLAIDNSIANQPATLSVEGAITLYGF